MPEKMKNSWSITENTNFEYCFSVTISQLTTEQMVVIRSEQVSATAKEITGNTRVPTSLTNVVQ